MAEMRIRGTVDTRNYERGVDRMKKKNEGFAKQTNGLGRTIRRVFAAGVVIAFVRQAVRSLAQWASQISITARNLGIMTSEMIALNRQAIGFNLNASDVGRILSRLSTELHRAARDGGDAADKFESLGLNIADLVRLDPVEQLREVARAAMESGMPLENLANIFGERLGPRAVAMLQELAENGLQPISDEAAQAADRAEHLGTVWARTMDQIREWTLRAYNVFHNFVAAVGAFFGAISAGGNLTEALRAVSDVYEEQEDAIDRLAEERDRQRKQRIEEQTRMIEDRLRKEAEAQAEMDRKRSERIAEDIRKIEESVGLDFDTDAMRRIGGFAGAQVSEQFQLARQQVEISRRISEYTRSLPAIEQNTRDQGGLT